MEIKDMKLTDIQARKLELDAFNPEDATIEEIEKNTQELRSLNEQETAILKAAEERKKQIASVINDPNPTIIKEFKEERQMNEEMTTEERRASEEYRSAYLKKLQGKALNEIEQRLYDNEMTTGDVAGVIPTITYDRIFEKLVQLAPILSEITLLQVPGNVTFALPGVEEDAVLHAENALQSPAADTLLSVNLAGYEIIKVLRISATVQAMSINAFESWLVQYLAKGIVKKIGAYIFYGTGENQPKGVDKAQVWASGTNANVWTGTSNTVVPKDLVATAGLLKGGYHSNAKWAMNSKMFWSEVVARQENDKYKLLTDDYKRLLGYEILLDDNMKDNEIFFGDFSYVVANLAQNVKVDRSTESGFLNNSIDYRGTAIFDSDIAIGEAFVKSVKTL